MTARRANVWYGRCRVAELAEGSDGRLHLAYAPEWLDDGFPISLSLPLEAREGDAPPRDAHDFFAGLLPEASARARIARERRIAEDDDIGLLLEIGRDCAGAFSVLPTHEHPTIAEHAAAPLEPAELSRLLLSRGHSVPDAAHPRRFSLAGAQDKVAVIVRDDTFALPDQAHPSNAILKFETIRWVCFAEHAGNALARRLGLDVPRTTYRVHDGTPYLLVARYDRRISTHANGEVIERLHQEDLAQALGYPSSRKYESDGGPTLPQIAELLRRHVRDPVRELERLRDWQITNYLIGNYDGHAKNLSILYESIDSVPVLAPFYDMVCIELMNRIGVSSYERALAFSIAGASEPERIRRSDWEQWAKDMAFPARRVLARLEELALAAPAAARDERAAFAATHGDNQAYDYFEESIDDRCRWTLNNVIVRR